MVAEAGVETLIGLGADTHYHLREQRGDQPCG